MCIPLEKILSAPTVLFLFVEQNHHLSTDKNEHNFIKHFPASSLLKLPPRLILSFGTKTFKWKTFYPSHIYMLFESMPLFRTHFPNGFRANVPEHFRIFQLFTSCSIIEEMYYAENLNDMQVIFLSFTLDISLVR